jgi:DNA modification methylase
MKTRVQNDERVRRVLAQVSGSKAHGQKIEPRRFHPFPARMPLALAKYLIRNVTEPDALVLDPMAGSGTTLSAAQQLGRESLGFDRDPMAVLLARTVTRSFDGKQLDSLRDRVLEKAKHAHAGLDPRKERSKLPEEDQKFLFFWFPEIAQKQLFALAVAITEEHDDAERELAWVIFSSLIIAKSAGASLALDISRSRPHRKNDKPIVLPFDGWIPRFKTAKVRLPFVDTVPTGRSTVEAADARSLPLKCESVDLVLTSPPYLNAIDYIRAHKFSLVWMGQNLAELRELRGTMVGTERGLWNPDGLPQALENQLTQDILANRRQAQIRQYLSDLRKVLLEICRTLRPEGLALLLAGPRLVADQNADAQEVLGQIAESVGLRVVGAAFRDLNASRRSLPPPLLVEENPLGRRMNQEVILALRR